MPITHDDIYEAADALKSIGTMGLNYSLSEYDTDRYQRTLNIALKLLSKLEDRSIDVLEAEYRRDILAHVSPINGAEAAVFREGKLLLIRRKDNSLWAMPGGMIEIGEHAALAAERELWEETGLRGRATNMLGLFDSRFWNCKSKRQIYLHVFEVHVLEGEPTISNETLDARFFDPSQLPPLDPCHVGRIDVILKQQRGELRIPFFDETHT